MSYNMNLQNTLQYVFLCPVNCWMFKWLEQNSENTPELEINNETRST